MFPKAVLNWVESPQGRIYALLDAARDEKVLEWIRASKLPYAILYNGQLANALEDAGPYLVALSETEGSVHSLLEAGWADHWGLLIDSRLGAEELRAHLRYFTTATVNDGIRVLFAFYDPRAFASFIDCATESQKATFFQGVSSVSFPSLDDDGIIQMNCVSRNSIVVPQIRTSENRVRHLSFSTEQMERFELGVTASLAHRLTAAIRKNMPHTVGSTTYRDLLHFIGILILEAQAMGAESYAAISHFVSMSVSMGRPITCLNVVREYLSIGDGLSVDGKLSKICEIAANPTRQ